MSPADVPPAPERRFSLDICRITVDNGLMSFLAIRLKSAEPTKGIVLTANRARHLAARLVEMADQVDAVDRGEYQS